MKNLLVSIVFFVLIVCCQAKIITVDDNGPADYKTIQEAVNKSWNGDTIIVKPGTYNETVVFNSRAVTLRSTDPNDPAVVQLTVINGKAPYGVVFDFGEGAGSVMSGFTVTGRGINCVGTSPTISKNVIRNCLNRGIYGQSNAAPTIVGNTIISNKAEGIYACAGLIRDNTISDNSLGIAYCDGPIQNNIISNNSNTTPGLGGGLYLCNGEVSGNVIRGNYAAYRGGGLNGCGGDIHNNVIAGNRADVSGGGLYNCIKKVCNNTIVGNVTGGDGGGLGECAGAVCNNIIAFNQADSAAAIYGLCSSSYNNFWMNTGVNFGGGAAPGVGDIVVDPLFAIDGYWDDNGTTAEGDDFWVHGDYHLKSQIGRWEPIARTWVVDEATSYCIDAGNPTDDWTDELWPNGKRISMGAYGGTPEASMSLIDLGNIADLNHDDTVDYADLNLWAQQWLLSDILLPGDFNRNGVVDFGDFLISTENWRADPPPPRPPIPDPMTFAVKPYATSAYSIAMVATTAISTDGSGVEYYFEEFDYPERNSGWISFLPGQEPRWGDTGLTPDNVYRYRVKARNKSNLLKTDWSDMYIAITLREDTTAPTPNPATWQTPPYASSATSIKMVATTASDDSGVEYQFECTSHAVYTSSWQDSSVYEVTSLPKSHYSFVVRARDKSPNHNTTAHSTEVTVDLAPPTPDPMQWQTQPHEINIGGGAFDYYATMTAKTATDDSTPVQYYFECTTQSGFNSGWISSTTYTKLVGRAGQGHRFRVKARDSAGNETGWSSTVVAN